MVSVHVALLLFVTHWVIDYCTSRITSQLWQAGDVHYFFVVVGFDQLLHLLSIYWIFSMCGFELM